MTSFATRRGLALAGSAMALAVGVAACGGDDSGSGGASSGSSGGGDPVKVGLITKTETNPFFVKMKEGARAPASPPGPRCSRSRARRTATTSRQVAAVESLISAGAKGLMITPSDSKAIVPSLDKARQAGLLVVALDTQTEPADAADVTYATDNYAAGQAIGKWAKGTFENAGKEAKIAMLDLNPDGVSVDVQRDQGFLEGFGVDVERQDQDRRRVRPADRRPRRDRRRRGGRSHGDGEPAPEGPVDQPRLHHQRARGRGRVRGR